jgi:DNA-binding response OmpR family regulator
MLPQVQVKLGAARKLSKERPMYALLVATDADEMAILSTVLKRVGLAVNTASDPVRAAQTWHDRPADLILSATKQDSLATVHRFRSVTTAPLVLIVDHIEEETHCKLLEAGADWVFSRPFSARLLIAQLKAIVRRAGGVQLFSLPTLHLAGLTLDPATRSVRVPGLPSRRLTHLEFRLLYTLMIHHQQILSSEDIVTRVWGYSDRGDRELVRGLVRRLRAKVEPDPSQPRYIVTVPGTGYVFASEAPV